MAQIDDLYTALKNADAAGDTAGAQKLAAYIKGMPAAEAAPAAAPAASAAEPSRMDQFVAGLKNPVGKNAALGAVEHAANIGATIMQPFQWAEDKLTGKTAPTLSGLVTGQRPQSSNQQTRAGIAGAVDEIGADRNSLGYQGAGLMTDIAATAGVGGTLGAGARVLGAAPRVVNALSSGGLTTGGPVAPNMLARGADMALRVGGGAATGAASAGLVDPSQVGTGAVIGGALPPAIRAAGAVGSAVGKVGAAAGNKIVGKVSPEVAALAQRAEDLGIQVPADRIANSKPLNAIASGLNYVPLSGRAGVERRMQDQLNVALTKTFGQDSPNVTQALRKAQADLGGEFDRVLKGNSVNVDQQFLTDLADAANKAGRELGSDGAAIIGKQVDDIVSKAGTGQIDGQAAYNIKRTLDRIGQRNSPEAHYATDLKKALMGALDRSLGPTEAAAFATTRKQYGNMLDLQKLAQNGAEGDVSIARVANMKNLNNPDMQELADIAAQFLKPREGQHGAAQRAFAGMGVGGLAGLPVLGAGMAAGRGANALLDSQAFRNALLSKPNTQGLINLDDVNQLLRYSAPVAGSRQ